MDEHRAILDYHERSKHQLRRYAPGPGYLDWANQPDPFRTYEGAPRVALALAADEMRTRFADVRAGRLPPAAPVTGETIGVLLELSLAISAWKSFHGSSWALRCNPSSGNLHPTEGYIVAADLPGLDGGVYHYVSRDHALEQRARWDSPAPPIEHGVIVGLASIYWREAWKYGMRAFRYCQHDCGHAIAAVSYAAASLGWQTRMLDAVADEDVAALLGLDRAADYRVAEREEPDCLLWVGSGEPPAIDALVAAARTAHWSGTPNRLSTEHVQWPDIDLAHDATRKPRTPPARSPAGATVALAAPRLDLAASTLFRQRRSAVDFDAVTSIPAEVFYAMLEPLLPRAGTPPWNAWPWAPRVHLGLFVHRVEGLEPGLYAFLRDDSALEPLQQAMRPEWLWRKLGPAHLPLYLLLRARYARYCEGDLLSSGHRRRLLLRARDACQTSKASRSRPGAIPGCTGSAGWSGRRCTSRPRPRESGRPASAASSTTRCTGCWGSRGMRGRACTTSPRAAQWTIHA